MQLQLVLAGLLCVAQSTARVMGLQDSKQDFGVGFSLSLEYGTASIYCPNGSIVDVARVDGNSKYRKLMRAVAQESLLVLPPLEEEARYIAPHDDSDSPRNTHAWLGLQTTIQSWFINEKKGMTDMIRSLKAVTESLIEQPVSIAHTAVPFPLSNGFKESISAAYRANGLKALHQPSLAGHLVAKHACLTGNCWEGPGMRDDPAQLFVLLDYSKAALTITLSEEECGVFDWLRVTHAEDLGADAAWECRLVASSGGQGEDDAGRDACQASLRAFVERAVAPVADPQVPSSVAAVLAIGEDAASDPSLLRTVEDVLRARLGLSSLTSGASRPLGQSEVHPLFGPARGAAADAWAGMERARRAHERHCKDAAAGDELR